MRGARSPWFPRVRAAVAVLAEPFTTVDVVQALGEENVAAPRNIVFEVLDHLADTNELDKELAKRGRRVTHCLWRRTSTFRAEEPRPEVQAAASVDLQTLCLGWLMAREEEKRYARAAE